MSLWDAGITGGGFMLYSIKLALRFLKKKKTRNRLAKGDSDFAIIYIPKRYKHTAFKR